jgi:hypothetical protein
MTLDTDEAFRLAQGIATRHQDTLDRLGKEDAMTLDLDALEAAALDGDYVPSEAILTLIRDLIAAALELDHWRKTHPECVEWHTEEVAKEHAL